LVAFHNQIDNTPDYVLRLYVAGMSSRSLAAIAKVKSLCEQRLKDRYELEIIDIYQQPELASQAQIVALPTLVRESPQPLRKMIGEMTDESRILAGLEIPPMPLDEKTT